MAEVIKDRFISIVKIPKDEIDKIDLAICQEPKETISHFYNRQNVKPDFICNAGFFNMANGESVYFVKNENVVVSTHSNSALKNGIGIKRDGSLKYGNIDEGDYVDFLSAYPVLVVNGAVLDITYATEIASRNPRTAIGYNDDFIFVVAVDGRTTTAKGMTLNELAEYMKKIGCDYAVNLDGGYSTRLHDKDNNPINNPTVNRAVDSVFAFYLKKIDEDPAVMALARAGIITDPNHWNRLLSGHGGTTVDNIRTLFQRMATALQSVQKDGLYRVQVGAFSKRENAENLLKTLQDKGFTGYIK